jgi:hypothetical protein
VDTNKVHSGEKKEAHLTCIVRGNPVPKVRGLDQLVRGNPVPKVRGSYKLFRGYQVFKSEGGQIN